jgi:transcriptional regulator with XRE-family HTH domain
MHTNEPHGVGCCIPNMNNRKLSRDNVRIGENLRQAILRARAKDPSLTNKQIAEVAGIHPVTLSRIASGYGASMATIESIAGVIGADANKILSKGTRKPLYSVRSIEEVLNDDRILYQFIGGCDDAAVDWAKRMIYKVYDTCRKRRAEYYESIS